MAVRKYAETIPKMGSYAAQAFGPAFKILSGFQKAVLIYRSWCIPQKDNTKILLLKSSLCHLSDNHHSKYLPNFEFDIYLFAIGTIKSVYEMSVFLV